MVLVYVVYSRRRETAVRYAGPDDDVRENIINYEDEGGGEDDMTAYDMYFKGSMKDSRVSDDVVESSLKGLPEIG